METQNKLLPASLKTGLIIGVVGIVVFLFYYITGIQFIGIFKPILMMLIGLAINIVILVITLKKFRNDTGGYISFLNAFLFGFIALIIAAVISALFNYVFVNYFDPDYLKNMLMAQRDWMENYMTGKASDAQIADALEKIDEQGKNAGSVLTLLKGLIWNTIFAGIVALIVGAIMQKKADVFGDSTSGGTV